MTDNIASDGKRDLFASFRQAAWHGLGTVFTETVTTFEKMLDLAGLSGWNLRLVPLGALSDEGVLIPNLSWVTTQYALVADMYGETRVLGVVGDRYEIISNEQAFSFLQSLSDGARWETAGAIKQGRVVFGSLAFDRDFTIDPSGVADVVKTYLLVHTSHDGSKATGGGMTPTRVVCQNTLNVALGNIKSTFSIRHTRNAEERMAMQAEAWRKAHVYFDAFEVEAQSLFQQKVTNDQFFGIVDGLFPKPEEDKKGAFAKWENKRSIFAQAWNGAPNAGIRGTGWGAFNALTEANQWGRNQQSTDSGEENFFAAGAGFDGPTNAFRQQALTAVKSLA
jgi:phage/plasmid-like protein (TIGR03299 family)